MWIFKHNNPFASETNSVPERSRLLRKGGKLGKSGNLKKIFWEFVTPDV